MNVYENRYSPVEVDWNKIVASKDTSRTEECLKWETCTIGQLSKHIKRLRNHSPLDYTLASLGLEFAGAYYNQDWTYCKQILSKIEKRADEMLNGTGNGDTE